MKKTVNYTLSEYLFKRWFRTIFVLCFCGIGISCLAQPIKDWDRDFGGEGWEDCNAAIQTSDFGYLLGGITTSDISGDVDQATRDDLSLPWWFNVRGDYWIIRTDEDGNELWNARFGGNKEDRLWGISTTDDGGFILGGQSYSDISGEKTDSCRGDSDYWIVKIDELGNKEWDRTYGGDSTDILNVLLQTQDGGYMLGGWSISSGWTASDSIGEKSDTLRGDYDWWVVKIDPSGNIEWEESYGGNETEQLADIKQKEDGTYLIAGGTESDTNGEVDSLPRGGRDFWVLHIDPLGNKLNEFRYGSAEFDDLNQIIVTQDSGYLLAGSSLAMAPSGDKTDPGYGSFDWWVMKIDTTGTIEWQHTFGGSDLENVYSLSQNSVDHYLLGGLSRSDDGVLAEPSKGSYDYWIMYLDPAGNEVWNARYGGNEAESLENIFQVNDGGYLMAGHSRTDVDQDKEDPNKGFNDFWIIKTLCNINLELNDTIVCPGEEITISAYDPNCLDCTYSWSDSNVNDSIRVINTDSEITYSVTLTDGVGCQRSDEITVSVHTLPLVDLGDIIALCEGDSISLDAGPGGEVYVWNTLDSNQIITVDSTANYAVTVSDENNCITADSVFVEVLPIPLVDLGNDTTLCDGTTYSLDAGNPGANYQWGGGQNDQIVDVSSSNIYGVIVTGANGCTDADIIEVTFNEAPAVVNIVETCDLFNTSYIVTFEISGGEAGTYTVTGDNGILNGNLFTSDAIPVDSNYSFFIDDINACGPIEVSGSYNCPCITDAGGLVENSLVICGDEILTANPIGSVLDGNDIIEYILHDGNASSIGAIIYSTTVPEFSFQGNMQYGQTYFVTIIAGTDDGNGNVSSQDGCYSESLGVPIVFYESPIAVITPTTDTELDCIESSLHLSGGDSQAQGGIDFSWSVDGTGNIVSGTTFDFVEIDEAGNYVLTITDQATGCTASSAIQISSNLEHPIAIIADAEPITCFENTIQLDGTGSSVGPEYSYQWSGGSIESGGQTLMPVVSESSNYTLMVTNDINGCTDSEQIFVAENTVLPIVDAGPTQHLDCIEQEATLIGSHNVTNGSVAIEWIANPGNIVSGANSLSPIVDSNGIYTLFITNSITGCIGEATVQVTLETNIPTAADIQADDPDCYGDENGSISIVEVQGGIAPFTYSIDGINFYSANQFSNLSANQYQLTIQDAFGCEWDTVITLQAASELVVELGDNLEIELGDSIQLDAFINQPIDTFFWNLTGLNDLNPYVQPLEQMTYVLEVSNENGCIAEDFITVVVRKNRSVYVPNAFSPDGDGMNDYFTIYSDQSVSNIKTFRIFDRWGETVFVKNNMTPNTEQDGWNGKLNGEDLQPGVFIFFAEIEFIDGRVEIIKGDVTLAY